MNAAIGFVGLGRMGGAIAQRLHAAGCKLVVCDPDAAATAPFARAGAAIAPDAAAVADQAAIVFGCLPSVEIAEQAAIGARGVIAGAAVRCYVETSTIGPEAVTRIAAKLHARAISLVDCPVSGGPSAASEGRLRMIVSGDPAAVAEVKPLLNLIGDRVFEMGPQPGAAQMCKLVNNALSLVGMALACEAVVVGVRAGLDAEALLEVINASTGRNGATLDKFPKAILPRTFDFGGPLGAAPKDLGLFLDEAARFAIPVGVTQAGAALWALAAAEGDPGRDYTTLIKTVERWAGVEVVGRKPAPAPE